MADEFDPNTRHPFAVRGIQPAGAHGQPAQPPGPEPMNRHAAEWGLASLLFGGIVVMCMPPLVPFLLLYYLNGREVSATAPASAMAVMYLGVYVACILAIGSALISLLMGIRALFSASWNRQPVGLPLAGTLTSAAAVVVTIFMTIGALMIIHAYPAARP
jgi:hypothetical protein